MIYRAFQVFLLVAISIALHACRSDNESQPESTAKGAELKADWRYGLPYTFIDSNNYHEGRELKDVGIVSEVAKVQRIKQMYEPAVPVPEPVQPLDPSLADVPETQVVEIPQEREIFTIVEQMPMFKGGEAGLMTYLAKNKLYPVSAIEQKLEGDVFVGFVIETDGQVAEVAVTRGTGTILDKAAKYAVMNMPDWIPGRQRGKAVVVRYVVPFRYKLKEGGNYTVDELERARELEEKLKELE